MAQQLQLNVELLSVAFTVIDSLEDELSDESFAKLGAILPQNMVIAALDLIDRGNVIKHISPWGKVDYEVLGSTATYLVQLDLPSRVPFFCACPAFTKAVLSSRTHIMCKHILAALISRKYSLSSERMLTADEVVELFARHYSS